MTLDEIMLDDEDFCFDLSPDLEQSFGVKFDRDLGHVHTVGDLFDEMTKQREPLDSGNRCDTAMVFYSLRRVLVGHGLNARAWPSTPLSGQGLPSPRKIRKLVARELDLKLPSVVMTGWGCVLSASLAMTIIACWMLSWAWALPFAIVGIPIILHYDRGSWSGDWKTLGSLALAVAIRNVTKLGGSGARSRRSDWWRAYTQLLAGHAFDDKRSVTRDEIGPETRFRFT